MIAATGEHEFEAVRGLPERLPPGERILWQGSPSWFAIARDSLHLNKVLLWFAVLLAWRASEVAGDGGGLAAIATGIVGSLAIAILAISLILLFAWLMARNAVYTITNERVVMRIGIVLSLTFNLPFSQIAAATLRPNRDGTGDIALELTNDQRIAWLHLWPHARPWHLRKSQPMLRAVPDAQRIGRLLADVAQARSAAQA